MDRKGKVIKELKRSKIDLAILVSPSNVIYSSGFEVPYQPAFMGDMSRGLPMVVSCIGTESEILQLTASDFYRTKLERAGKENVCYYRSFTHEAYNDVAVNFKRALHEAIKKCTSTASKAVIGIEQEQCPIYVLEVIRELFPDTEFQDITKCVAQARMIKMPEEIILIEEAAKAADLAQTRLIEISNTEGSYTELEIWFEVQKAVSEQTKVLTPFVGELVTGPRTGLSDYPLGPTNRKVERGDIAIMDISPRVNGYWADCSNAVVFWNEPNEEQLRYFKAVKEIYETGRDMIRPGVKCIEVNRRMEMVYKKNDFCLCSYQGHQIGASVNEMPKFTYCDDTVLEEDMIICIEPQIYTGKTGKTGIRLEKMLHITKDGAKELNQFQWGIH